MGSRSYAVEEMWVEHRALQAAKRMYGSGLDSSIISKSKAYIQTWKGHYLDAPRDRHTWQWFYRHGIEGWKNINNFLSR